MLNELNVIGVKAGNVYYITNYDGTKFNPYSSLKNYIINGKKLDCAFKEHWCVCDSEVKTVQIYQPVSPNNYRYELKDKSLKSEKLKEVFSREEFCYKDNDGYWEVKPEYKMYRSLYESKHDTCPEKLVDVEFTYKTIVELQKELIDNKFSYDIPLKYGYTIKQQITSDKIEHQFIDKLIFPNIALQQRPCKLSRQQTYDIIRQYVKDNINPLYAIITSDYDFCFTVQKRLRLHKPKIKLNNVNTWTKQKSEDKKRYTKDEYHICFEMAPKSYQSYPIIDCFVGNNEKDLQNNIDTYLKKLIDHINEPIVYCPTCSGYGYIKDNEKLAPKINN